MHQSASLLAITCRLTQWKPLQLIRLTSLKNTTYYYMLLGLAVANEVNMIDLHGGPEKVSC